MQEAVVSIYLLDFSILGIPVHMEVLSERTTVPPVVLEHAYLVYA